MRSPIIQVLRLLFVAPEPTPEHAFNRIRFMERDVFLTIKVLTLSLLAYFLYTTDPFEEGDMIRGIELETVRGAFLFYCVVTLTAAAAFLSMTWLPLIVLQWIVFVVNLTDGIFLAILVGLTGGLESAIYWVFLALIIRNAVSMPYQRRQLLLNVLVILCYMFATLIDRTRNEMKIAQQEFEQKLEERLEGAEAEPVLYMDANGNLYTNPPPNQIAVRVVDTDTDVDATCCCSPSAPTASARSGSSRHRSGRRSRNLPPDRTNCAPPDGSPRRSPISSRIPSQSSTTRPSVSPARSGKPNRTFMPRST
jgi:hypothetical protein